MSSHFRPGMNVNEKIDALSMGDASARKICRELSRLDVQYLNYLDEIDVTGKAIVGLFVVVCNCNIIEVCFVILACVGKIGEINRATLIHAIDNNGAGINIVDTIRKLLEAINTDPMIRRMIVRLS